MTKLLHRRARRCARRLLRLLLWALAGVSATAASDDGLPSAAGGAAPDYAASIQPIFNRRCIACHGCLGSPCKLKLDSFRGVDRGGFALNPYSAHFSDYPRTDLGAADSTQAWRRRGFYSILARGGASQENLDASLLYQMVAAGMRHNAPGFSRGALHGLRPDRYKARCAATPAALAAQLEQHPATGMPFGLPVQKNHFILRLAPDDIPHLTRLFAIDSGTGWDPASELDPPYGIENPFRQFAAIPAESRYRFILENAEVMVGGVTYGPVCNGQIATYAVKDRFWVFFLDPAHDPSVQEPLLGLDNAAALMDRSVLGTGAYLNAFAETKARLAPDGWSLDAIWDGDGADPGDRGNAWLTVLRLNHRGEQRIYSLVANRVYASQWTLLFQNGQALPNEDTMSVYPTLVNGFPNLFVDLDLAQAPDFLRDLAAVETDDAWRRFRERYAILRNSEYYWPVYDWLNDWKLSERGDAAGWLDLTYYDAPEL